MEALKFRDFQQLIYFLGKYIFFFHRGLYYILQGGGNSNIFCFFTSKNWGRWTHFDYVIFFRWVGSTTNQLNYTPPGSPRCLWRESRCRGWLDRKCLNMRFGNLFSPILRQQYQTAMLRESFCHLDCNCWKGLLMPSANNVAACWQEACW